MNDPLSYEFLLSFIILLYNKLIQTLGKFYKLIYDRLLAAYGK